MLAADLLRDFITAPADSFPEYLTIRAAPYLLRLEKEKN